MTETPGAVGGAPVGAEAAIGPPVAAAQPRSVTRRVLVGASGTLLLQVSSLVMGFGTAILLARLLGATGYGRYVFVLAWAGLLTTPAVLGLDRFLVREVAVYEVQGSWGQMHGLLRRSNQLVLATSLLIAAGSSLVALVVLSGSLRWMFCLAMLLIPLSGLTVLRQGGMQALGRVVSSQLPEYLIRPAFILAGIGILDLAGDGAVTATSALGLNVAGVALAFGAGAIMLRRALPDALRSARAQYETRAWLSASLPMLLIVGVWLANNYITTLVVGTLDSATAAGQYSVVEKGAELIVLVLVASNMSLAPAIARLHATADRAGMQHATERVAQVTLLVSAPIAISFAIFPGVYLGIFGSSFESAGTALTILALAQLVNAAAGPAGNVLVMTGHERAAARGIGAGLLANIILGVVLVPPLGVTGGAIASGASLVVWNTALLLLARHRVGVNVTALHWLAVR